SGHDEISNACEFLSRLSPIATHDERDGGEHGESAGDASGPAAERPGDAADRPADTAADIIEGDVETDGGRAAALRRQPDIARRRRLADEAESGGDREAGNDADDAGQQRHRDADAPADER